MAASEDDKQPPPKPPPAEGAPTQPLWQTPPSAATTDYGLVEATLAALRERYDLLGEIGRGGMGIVFRARDRETGDVVALKVLKPEVAARPDLIERFKAELLLARKITHKNVCRVYELNRFGPVAAISMEYVEGESLHSFLGRMGSVPLRKGLEWAGEISSALAEAHAQGVVHRDLKPENILLDKSGQAKVMDFGIARSLESDATKTGTFIGTPAYMSPEQAEGRPADVRSDIYSLGLILYEMFTGRRAFQADTPVALALKQVRETPPPPRSVEPTLPAYLDAVIQKCLEKDPARRYQSAAGLQVALSGKRPAPGLEEKEAALPARLLAGERLDWLLAALAVAGLALFLGFFDRVSLLAQVPVEFDRSVLRRIGQEYAERAGAPVTGARGGGMWWSREHYDYLVRRAGPVQALALANRPVWYWLWCVDWEPAPNLRRTMVCVGNKGQLASITRDFAPGDRPAAVPLEQAQVRAEAVLGDFFHRAPAGLKLETAAADNWLGNPAAKFTWADPAELYGLTHRYEIILVGEKIASLEERFDFPPGYVWRKPFNWQMPTGVVLMLVMLAIGFTQRHLVDLRARWRVRSTGLAFFVGGWCGWVSLGSYELAWNTFYFGAVGLLSAGMWFVASITIELAVRRLLPAGFASFARLFDRRALTPPVGLALVRGSLLGLGLMGVEIVLIHQGMARGWVWLDSFMHINQPGWTFLGSAFPAAGVVVNAALYALALGFFAIPFVTYVVARVVRQPLALLLVAAALTGAGGVAPALGAIQPNHWKVALLVFDTLVLVWAYLRYDMLTVVAAIFTFTFWWENYAMLKVYEPMGALGPWVTLGLWGAALAAAAVVAFQTPLLAAYRRVATFD